MAIKVVLTPATGASRDQVLLLREVQICRKISHTNIVRVYDIGHFPAGLFVVMELLSGSKLNEIIKKEAPLPLGRVQKLLIEIAAALGEAHRLKIVHRDLTPGHVMLVEGRVKVMGFGQAAAYSTASYMAPEQIQGLPLNGTCDLYALGVIAHTMLTGHEPFQAETLTAVAYMHLHEPPPDIREFRPELPSPWIEVLEKLLAKKPEDRYQSAAELIDALTSLST